MYVWIECMKDAEFPHGSWTHNHILLYQLSLTGRAHGFNPPPGNSASLLQTYLTLFLSMGHCHMICECMIYIILLLSANVMNFTDIFSYQVFYKLSLNKKKCLLNLFTCTCTMNYIYTCVVHCHSLNTCLKEQGLWTDIRFVYYVCHFNKHLLSHNICRVVMWKWYLMLLLSYHPNLVPGLFWFWYSYILFHFLKCVCIILYIFACVKFPLHM